MAYVLPQVLVFQEFRQIIAAITEPLRAFITGPQYDLKRYTDEKTEIGLGQYDPTMDQFYLWPNRSAGAIVDQEWTRLFMDSAWQQYWSNPNTIQMVGAVGTNLIRADSIVFKSYDIWDRDATFFDRDVQLGDGVRVRGNGEDVSTYVTDFVHEQIPSSMGAAEEDANNQAATVAAASVNQTGGTVNEVTADSVDGSAYDGLDEGNVTETYTVTVVQSSTGGDATTARFDVVSASGNDNVGSQPAAAFGMPTSIGTRGVTVTFTNEGSSSSSSSSAGMVPIPPETSDFVIGQSWTVQVTQNYTPVNADSGGTYGGPDNTTYVVTVLKGGIFAESPQITVSTTTGIDVSGPHTVTGAATPITIGNYGVTIEFDGPLCAGDKFYIDVVAQQDGAIKTLSLAHVLPDTLVGINLSVDLFIIDDIEVTQDRIGYAPLQNFETSDTGITTKSGIISYDPSWNNAGTLIPMSVWKGDMYVQYRALVQTNCSEVQTIDDIGDVISDLGPATPENPLSLGVMKALTNANGTDVKYMGVCSDDLEGYAAVADAIVGRDDIYSIVPLTQDREVQNLFQGHVNQMSTPENGRWRIAWFNSASTDEEGIVVGDEHGDPYLATVTDDPLTPGSQYTYVTWTDGLFLTNGVRAGDKFRTNYGNDGFGTSSYETYTVDLVISEDTLRLISGPPSPISVAAKFEVWRDLTKDEIAEAYGNISGTFGDRRIRHIWPDWVGSAGTQMEGFYLCAALAGLRSGVAPHQPLTNVEVAGFDDLSRSTEYFSTTQLNIMAGKGTWIVIQDLISGQIITRHQLTTGDYEDINQREDSVTTNVDSISYFYLRTFAPYIGRSNVTPEFITFLESTFAAASETLRASETDTLGPQIITAEILEFRQHTLLRDRVIAQVQLEIPYPFNNLELHLVI